MLNKSLWVIEDKNIHEKISKYSKNIRNYSKGSLIFRQEDVRDCLYFLIDGRVRVSISSPNGSEKTLAVHEAGSFFGETAFFDELPSFSYAEALRNSTVVILDKSQISLMIKEEPDLIFHIFKSMCRKIRLLTFQVEYLSFMKIEERLASLLLTLLLSFGIKCSETPPHSIEECEFKDFCSDGYILDLTITDQEIADMIGTRREGVTKAINNLKHQKVIYKNKRTICCPNLEKLDNLLATTE